MKLNLIAPVIVILLVICVLTIGSSHIVEATSKDSEENQHIIDYVLTQFSLEHTIEPKSIQILSSNFTDVYGHIVYHADVQVTSEGKHILFYLDNQTGKIYSYRMPTFEEITGITRISQELENRLQTASQNETLSLIVVLNVTGLWSATEGTTSGDPDKIRQNVIDHNKQVITPAVNNASSELKQIDGVQVINTFYLSPEIVVNARVSSINKILELPNVEKIILNTSMTLDSSYSSPLKQFKSGITFENITCKQDLVKIMKLGDGSPACVKQFTIDKLVSRNWGFDPSKGLEVEGLKSSYKVGEQINFRVKFNVLVGDCTGDPRVVVKNQTNQTVWESKFTLYPCPPDLTLRHAEGEFGFGSPKLGYLVINQTGSYYIHIWFGSELTKRIFVDSSKNLGEPSYPVQ